LFSILSLSGPSSGSPAGEPDRVSQMMVLIKTVSKTNSPLFCLSVIYIQKSLKRWKKDFFADTEKISGLNSTYFRAKTILFGDYFLAYFGL
jgi:pantothenate kinase type III